jgi:hypothetical protein
MLTAVFPTGFCNEPSPGSQEDQLPHRSHDDTIYRSPSTERSVSISPSVSSSSLGSPSFGPSCRRPIQVSPGVILSNPRLHALIRQIFSEPWFLNGKEERNVTDKEARSGLGSMGKSVFLAFAEPLRGRSSRAKAWRCLICDTLPAVLSDGKGYTIAREDRILKHIRHHFGHRPWVCGGQCGTGDW